MIFSFFRISGFDHAPDQLLHQWALEPSHVWDSGDISPRGQMYGDAGFTLPLPDAESWVQALPDLIDFIESKDGLFQELMDLGAQVELNIGMTVGVDASSLEFPKSLIADLGLHGIGVNLTAFPATEG
jgi:hypothetical protein